MSSRQSSQSWIICPKPNPNAQLKLFCFPYAGGGTLSFRKWGEELFPKIEVNLIQLPGREKRLQEKPYTRIEPLIKQLQSAIIPYLNQPFAFFGYSMGSLIAFELTRSLRRNYQLNPEHLFVCARRAPQLPRKKPPIHELPNAEFIQELLSLNGTPKEILTSDELMALFLPTIRADFEVIETYAYYHEMPLKIPITALGGLEDAEATQEDLAAWEIQTNNKFKLYILPGDHFFINSALPQLLQIICAKCTQIFPPHSSQKAK
ncbi:MAG: thioesterase domain-containing protein [Cyanobacteria bacterium P01_A01_bin.84]